MNITYQYSSPEDLKLFGENSWIDMPGIEPFVAENQLLRHVPSAKVFIRTSKGYEIYDINKKAKDENTNA